MTMITPSLAAGRRILTAHALERHYPDAAGTGSDALALLERVIDAQADLVAGWLGVGFVHGVMNTDNTAISGETIDYGPCAFLDEYDPRKTFSSIDRGGRYAFSHQPRIALWNVARLAETLLPQLSDDEEAAVRIATERLERFTARFEDAHLGVMRKKLGLMRSDDGDGTLVEELLAHLAANHVDFTLFFRRLSDEVAPAEQSTIATLFGEGGASFHSWLDAWRSRLATESLAPEAVAGAMRRANPAFIPRNQRVEEVIEAAVQRDDFAPFETLVEVLGRPYDDQPEHARLAEPPGPEQGPYKTFCGT